MSRRRIFEGGSVAVCAFCQSDAELCASHSIPDGFFRLISRQNSGKLIQIPAGAGNIHFSNETGKAKLLCKVCEAYFNKEFDSPLVNAFKMWDLQIIERGLTAGYNFSTEHIAQALASIFWSEHLPENWTVTEATI
ncbi:hypothetical protein EOW65_08385 [Sinirhodobacter ferrireducens]|uniref:HNH endonuclease n=1 Tax=Paenirhodobacter ferrireducens TaxID=1215032 RepID=A0A443LLA7_9RHOB|nr:hypothetical protein [Sinirhodobacter ferrireducens]RWR49960.1 hypothetical protein EOW65_08385 [Sinirhodobacter ferrireducens]